MAKTKTLKIGNQDPNVVARRDFENLAVQAEIQYEDDYWTKSALEAEAKSRKNGDKPIPFEQVERELSASNRGRANSKRRRKQ